MMACNEYIGVLIGNSIGRLEQVDVETGEVVWGEYMRIRVSLDITKPLMWKNKFTIGNLPPTWIHFSYERLLDYCYGYGIIGHNCKECST